MTTKDHSEQINLELARLRESQNPIEIDQTFVRLMALRALRIVRDKPEFMEGVECLLKIIYTDDNHRIHALVALTRLSKSLRTPLRDEISYKIAASLSAPLPPANQISEGSDREYIAQAMLLAKESWMPKYAAREIVLEENAENARTAFALKLLRDSGNLTSALRYVADAATMWTPRTQNVEETRLKRLRRVLGAFRRSITAERTREELDFGPSLTRLCDTFVDRYAVHLGIGGLEDVTIELLTILDEVIRSHISLATEASTYDVLILIRKWFEPGDWPDSLELQLRHVSDLLLESIELLARQGIADDGLMGAFRLLARGSATRRLSSLATENSSIDPKIQRWLMGVRTEQKLSYSRKTSREENLLNEFDDNVSRLLLKTLDISKRKKFIEDELTGTLLTVSPALELYVSKLLGSFDVAAQEVNVIAGRRNLETFGERGSIVDYSPLLHDLPDNAVGTRRVKIIEPGVLRRPPNDTIVVVVKSIVESI